MKVSFVCTSYRRFHCVNRILTQFDSQTYKNKELIIFNTDEEYPYRILEDREDVIIINNGIDYLTNTNYTNRGDILRDAITHTTGELFMLADDDDIYLPFHIQQAVDGIIENGKDCWKPEKSFFATRDKIELSMNTMEASCIVKMDRIKEIGFRNDLTGYEGLSWYTKLRDEGQLDEHNKKYIPSYCFNWGDPSEIAGHKQSGDINNPNNFDNHKEASADVAKSPLVGLSPIEMSKVFNPYFEFLKSKQNEFDEELWNRYCSTI